MLRSAGLVFCTVRGWSEGKIMGSGGRRWWGCTATQQIAGKDSSLHFIIIEYNSQSRAGTKPPLQVKCLRRFTIWRGCFYRRAPRVKIFLRASRASRALQFYIVSFSFSTTLYLRQCPLGSTLPPYFFFTLTFTFFFKKNFQKKFPSKSLFIKEIRSVSALISRDAHFHHHHHHHETMALMLRMCCFCVEVEQNGPHKVLPLICFEIYGLGGSGADQIRCRPIFQGFKMTKNVWTCLKMYDFELWWCLTHL